MNGRASFTPQFAFWGICIIGACWLVATAYFEVHLGWPTTGIQLAKRLVGWAVELWLVRTLTVGFHRYRPVTNK